MQKLKDVYDTKKQLVGTDITGLGIILKEYPAINTISVNSDNTIYVESNCGIDSIMNSLDEGIQRWLHVNENILYSAIFNKLPISNNSCIILI